jgi:hypothetical protein
MSRLTVDGPAQLQDLLEEVVETMLNMHIVKDNDQMSYEDRAKNIALIARMMWVRRETAAWKTGVEAEE